MISPKKVQTQKIFLFIFFYYYFLFILLDDKSQSSSNPKYAIYNKYVFLLPKPHFFCFFLTHLNPNPSPIKTTCNNTIDTHNFTEQHNFHTHKYSKNCKLKPWPPHN